MGKENSENKKKKKVRSIIGWILTGIFGSLFVVVAIGQIGGMIDRDKNYGQTLTYGFGSFIITTDSMKDVYPVDSAIITHKDSPSSIYESYLKGEVIDITFFDYYDSNGAKYNYDIVTPVKEENKDLNERTKSINEVMTHRLREIIVSNEKKEGEGKYTFIVAGTNISDHQSQKGQYQCLTENELLGRVKLSSSFIGGFFKFITTPWGLLVFLLIPAFYLVITSVLDIFKTIKEPDESEVVKEVGDGNSLEGISDKDKERLKREMLEEMMNRKKEEKKDD